MGTTPTELEATSPPLAKDEAARIWTAFLSDTRVSAFEGIDLYEFCGDGRGRGITVTMSLPELDGVEFDWVVVKNLGGRWNQSKMEIRVPDDVPFVATASGIIDYELYPPGDRPLPGVLYGSGSDGSAVHDIAPQADSICHE